MAIISNGKVYVNGDVVGSVREIEDAPRRYVLGGDK